MFAAASRPTSPAAACEDSISKSFAASPMLDPAPLASRSMLVAKTLASASLRASTIEPATVVSVTSPRVHTVSTRMSPTVSVRKMPDVVAASRSKALSTPVPTLISRKLPGVPMPPVTRPVPAVSRMFTPVTSVGVGSLPSRPSPRSASRIRSGDVSVTSEPVEVIAPARRSPLRSVTVTKPLVVMSILPLPSAGVSTSVIAVKLIVVAVEGCWIEMSRPERASANV